VGSPQGFGSGFGSMFSLANCFLTARIIASKVLTVSGDTLGETFADAPHGRSILTSLKSLLTSRVGHL